jgi:hypothetical protein
MPRSLEHEDFVGFRLSRAMHSALATAAASLGVNKSELVRAVVMRALRDEQLARAAIDSWQPNSNPSFWNVPALEPVFH